jgi:LuxR family transcriptional regulator, maltose regulon positive regulatory protein
MKGTVSRSWPPAGGATGPSRQAAASQGEAARQVPAPADVAGPPPARHDAGRAPKLVRPAAGDRPRPGARPRAGSQRPKAAGQGRPHFLEDKLQIPRPSFSVLHRRRVSALLDEATRHRVTLVTGPAGAGKTVACASWAASRPAAGKVVWLTTDSGDRRDWFWAYVFTALTRLRPAPAQALRMLEDAAAADFPMRLVEAAQSFSEPLVLVLDDVHELADPSVLTGLEVVLRHAPPTLRLVLSARQPPALQLARLRVCGDLADIGASDLACTPDEAAAYFTMLGITVGSAEREQVLSRTEGWMAGLRLAALRAGAGAGGANGAARAGQAAAVTGLAGDEPLVTDYLWDEVLARLEPQIRAFLLRTSIVSELPGGLADTLTGQAGGVRTLARLAKENSFVTVTGGGSYRYHPLLREVLTAELHRELPCEVPVLLRRAARWYTGAGQPLAAVRCAAQAGDWDEAALVLAASGPGALTAAGPADLESVLALFPADRATGDVAVAAAWASARLWAADAEGAAMYLDEASRALEAASPALRAVMAPTLAALRIMAAAEQGQDQPPPAQVYDLASPPQRAASPGEHRALGLLWFALGMTSMRRWAAGEASGALRRADSHLGSGGLAGLQARARAWRALAQACSADLTAARRSAAGPRKEAPGRAPQASFLASLGYAQISLAADDLIEAQRLLDELDPVRAGHVPGELPVAAAAELIRARILIADGDPTAARAALSRLRDAWAPGCPGLSEAITVAEADAALRAGDSGRARALLLLTDDGGGARGDALTAGVALLLAEGDYAAAVTAAKPVLEDQAATRWERISALLATAVAQRRLGDSAVAAGLVEDALALGEAEGAYRPFLDAGPAARSAITVLVPPTSRYAGFAGRILERFDTQGARLSLAAERGTVRLTDSERAVLCFLPSHMTNEEISQALFLSVNTVKTHLRSAYRKLGVSSRREAIARGRGLGLLLASERAAGAAGGQACPAPSRRSRSAMKPISAASMTSQMPIRTTSAVSDTLGQKITSRPTARLSTPDSAVRPRAGVPCPAATARSATPCTAQYSPTMTASRATVTSMCRRQ